MCRSPFIDKSLDALDLQLYLKQDVSTGSSCEHCEICQSTFFFSRPRDDCSDFTSVNNSIIETYRNYKTFDKNKFNEDLKSKLDSIEKLDCPLFESVFIDILNTHAPVTTKKVRANNHQFMTKALRKAIMTRSRLKNAYLKTRNSKNWENYKKQRNFCTNLLKKNKK